MADESTPLKVLIVGGGIGGLAAAISIRRQGHHVEVRLRTIIKLSSLFNDANELS